MVALKLIAIPAGTITGILGATSPLIHIEVTSSSWKEKWHKRADFSIPIFKNCKIKDPSGSESNNPISVYLAFNDKKPEEISLKVIETVRGQDKIVWEVWKGEEAGGGLKRVAISI